MQIITETEYTEFMTHDQRELFELFGNQSFYYEATLTQLDLVTTPVAMLCYFGDADVGMYNASCFFEHDGTEYAYKKIKSEMKFAYFKYANITDAKAHMMSILNAEMIDDYV